jgi:hypothetical protein
VIKLLPYLLFPSKARKETGADLELLEWHFECHILLGEQIGCLENSGHATAGDNLGDKKPVIESLPRLEIMHGTFGSRAMY